MRLEGFVVSSRDKVCSKTAVPASTSASFRGTSTWGQPFVRFSFAHFPRTIPPAGDSAHPADVVNTRLSSRSLFLVTAGSLEGQPCRVRACGLVSLIPAPLVTQLLLCGVAGQPAFSGWSRLETFSGSVHFPGPPAASPLVLPSLWNSSPRAASKPVRLQLGCRGDKSLRQVIKKRKLFKKQKSQKTVTKMPVSVHLCSLDCRPYICDCARLFVFGEFWNMNVLIAASCKRSQQSSGDWCTKIICFSLKEIVQTESSPEKRFEDTTENMPGRFLQMKISQSVAQVCTLGPQRKKSEVSPCSSLYMLDSLTSTPVQESFLMFTLLVLSLKCSLLSHAQPVPKSKAQRG